MGQSIAGRHLKCKHCEGDAWVEETERRYYVRCPQGCPTELLKEYNLKR